MNDAIRIAKMVKPIARVRLEKGGVPTSAAEQTIINQHRGTGLEFPENESARRLGAKAKRKPDAGKPANPRTVIKAPKKSNLPDFVTGDINYNDWVARHEHILDTNEIKHASEWYKRVYPDFQQYQPDPNKVKKDAKAWLVAQQNISPAGAMNNVLMQKEQMARGVPEHLWTAGGMPNPTAAAREVLQNKPITGGVGQKIADFVDSAEGKPVRSWMGNHPKGGAPFVVDVHTARDAGMVDEELINHLTRLGYDPKQLAKLKKDLGTSPSESQYENRADWGRGLTGHLNKIGWQGRNDWTPAEVQAVGWMGMTKLTRNAEEDSESGLGRNFRRISYEIAPGLGSPWEQKYASALEALPEDDRYAITHSVAAHAMDHAAKLAGIDVHSLVHGTGAWKQYQNPAAVGQSLATQKGADIAANALGYMLNQTEVWHNRAKPITANPKGFGVDFIEHGSNHLADKDKLKDFWQKIMAADESKLLEGYQPITLPTGETGIRALIPKGGEKTKQAIENALQPGGSLHTALSAMPFNVNIGGHESEITKAHNDWSKDKNGESYLARLGETLGRDPTGELNSARSQLETHLENHLDQAHARQGTTWRQPQGTPPTKQVEPPHEARGGFIRRAYKKGGKVEGSIWHARDAFDEGGNVRAGDSVGGLHGDTGGFSEHDVGEEQGKINEATAAAQEARQGVQRMDEAFGPTPKGPETSAFNSGNGEPPPVAANIMPRSTTPGGILAGSQPPTPESSDYSIVNPFSAPKQMPIGVTGIGAPSSGINMSQTPAQMASAVSAEAGAPAGDPNNPASYFGEPTQFAKTDFSQMPQMGFNAGAAGTPAGSIAAMQPQHYEPTANKIDPTLGKTDFSQFSQMGFNSGAAGTPVGSIAAMQPQHYEPMGNKMPDFTGVTAPAGNVQTAALPAPNVQPNAPHSLTPNTASTPQPSVSSAYTETQPSIADQANAAIPTPMNGVPTPPIPLRDLQGPSIAEGIAGLFGLSTQQQFDKFYNGYIGQGHNETDAYNKAIGDIQTMRANAQPGPFDRSGKTQKIQKLMPDGTYQWVDAPYKRGGGVHSSQIVDHVLAKFGAPLPALNNPYYGNKAGRR